MECGLGHVSGHRFAFGMRVPVLLASLLGHASAGTNEFGKTFLAKMRTEPGVVELPSGLMYKVLREGDGEEHPLASTSCECHYEGRTAQEYSKEPKGKKFDSSYDRGSSTSFAPNGVIAGWTEAMQLMVQGDKWEMYIPSELGYGDGGQGGDIGGGDVLVFTMEILKIDGPSKPAERGPPPFVEFSSSESALQEYDAWAAKVPDSQPLVLAVLRQPIGSSKLFKAFKGAARAVGKRNGADASRPDADALQFGVTAAKFVKGSYVDPLAKHLKLNAPAVYLSFDRSQWVKCKLGRPTEMEAGEIQAEIEACVASTGHPGMKREL